MGFKNSDFRNKGKFVASCFKIGETDVSIIADPYYNKTVVCFNFEPVEYLNGTTRRVIKESFEAALKRYRIIYGEPAIEELDEYTKELNNVLSFLRKNDCQEINNNIDNNEETNIEKC